MSNIDNQFTLAEGPTKGITSGEDANKSVAAPAESGGIGPSPNVERWLVTARWKEKVAGKEVWRSGSWTESKGDIETIERILEAKIG